MIRLSTNQKPPELPTTPTEFCNRCRHRGKSRTNPCCRWSGKSERIRSNSFMCPLPTREDGPMLIQQQLFS